MKFVIRSGVAALLLSHAVAAPAVHPQFGFPLYTNKPPGRQMAGQWVAASTPARTPEEERQLFKVPPGFEVRLFAADPDIANPVAMTWDDRGRLWVLELYEYPLGAKPGQPGRDRIKILEDSDGDGRADKVTVFADGFSLATGLAVGNGGVYVGQAPHLYFLEDTNGDDVADRKTPVLTGFGLEDRHELLNGFTWGPDGQLYLTHGVFTHSKVVNADGNSTNNAPVVLTAGVARFHPGTRHFEIYAEGTSNPWGVDFDARGNAFVSACVIDHLFHLVPGGLYVRQAGQPPFPYAYELLPSIVDHKHHMAAYAGVCVYQGDQWPKEWQGEILMGNIHQNALNHDHVEASDSTFKATARDDFLTTSDGWFMPVSTQVGPDGAAWVMDWYDKYPCYQNANADPDGVDREHGRIWRVVWVGNQPGKPVMSRPAGLNLGKASSEELVKTLAHPNVWHRRMAQRILTGRKDPETREPLVKLMRGGATVSERLAALWTLYSSEQIDDGILEIAFNSTEPALRTWGVRFTGERHAAEQESVDRLVRGAKDRDPHVRLAAATAIRQYTSGALTVDTTPPASSRTIPIGPLIAAMIEGSRDASDPVVSFMIWMAAEPVMARNAAMSFSWFAQLGMTNMPMSGKILGKTLRRVCDTRDALMLDRALAFLDKLPETSASLLVAALDGLIEGQRGKALVPTQPTEAFINRLLASANADLAARARQLGTLWGDAAALRATLAKIVDPTTPEAERLKAIQSARQTKTDDTRSVLLGVIANQASLPVVLEATRALGEVGTDATGERLIAGWSNSVPAARRAIAELLTTRPRWSYSLVAAVKNGQIARGDLPPTVIRNLATHKNDDLRTAAQGVFGKVNASSAEKLKLIEAKRKVVATGSIDIAAGHEVAKKACLICHKMYGEGAEVGPDLTGVGRSSLDALLHNVIHPNEIIGQGYENVEVETKDGRTITGRMIENTDNRVRILMAGPQEEVIAKGEVKSLRVSENSAMPEGLEQMPDEDFRNLIWYILAPPGDNKPLNEERKRELINSGGDQAAAGSSTDGESVALWNPEWRVSCPAFEGAPAKLPEFAGRRNVLLTHPVDRQTPAVIERSITLPAGVKAQLTFAVAAHEQGDWELRVTADGRTLHQQKVTHDGARWKAVSVDLSNLAGKTTVLRLENRANDWSWEFGYWADLQIRTSQLAQTQAPGQ